MRLTVTVSTEHHCILKLGLENGELGGPTDPLCSSLGYNVVEVHHVPPALVAHCALSALEFVCVQPSLRYEDQASAVAHFSQLRGIDPFAYLKP